MGIRAHKALTPGRGQEELELFPEENLPLNERFEDIQPPVRGLLVTVAREVAGGHIRRLLYDIAYKEARTVEEMEEAWRILSAMQTMSEEELATAINRMELSHEYPVDSRRGITIAAIRRTFNHTHRDEPAEILRRLGETPTTLKDWIALREYAIRQELTTRADVDRHWVNFFRGDTADKITTNRIYADFLKSSELPDWQKTAARRDEKLKVQTVTAPSSINPREPAHPKGTLF